MDGFVNEKLAESHPGIYHPMGITAECVAKRYNVSREAQDEIAFESQKEQLQLKRLESLLMK